MNAGEALARTMMLMRTSLRSDAPSHVLLDALLGTEVALVADANNLSCAEGQTALITAAALIARSGAQCYLEAPDVALQGVAAPLTSGGIASSLLDFGADLIPQCRILPGVPSRRINLAVLIGDTRWTGDAEQVVFISGNEWTGRIGSQAERWKPYGSPFGALSSAGLAAGEAFKAAMRRLRAWASGPGTFDNFFAPTMAADVELAPPGTPLTSPDLGHFDVVSGGAIAQAALYSLTRIPGARGEARVIEPERNDITNLNRYSFLRRSRLDEPKAQHLASLDLGELRIIGVPVRYEERSLDQIGTLAARTLVGVDHVPSRWAVQRARPRWLGIGATVDYSTLVSFHTRGLACACCLHQNGTELPHEIPTAAFVSHWAGLWLASRFARTTSGMCIDVAEQQLYMTTLHPEWPSSIWRAPGVPTKGCELNCPL